MEEKIYNAYREREILKKDLGLNNQKGSSF